MLVKRYLPYVLLSGLAFGGAMSAAQAADYVIDTDGAHAFIQFKIKHLGYSWLIGEFTEFKGQFSYDADKPEASKVSVDINPASLSSNHAERDKHLRSKDFLAVDQYPEAKFVSTAYKPTGKDTAVLEGNLTLRGVTKPIKIEVKHIGEGQDPWGGYRSGFAGTTSFALADYGIDYNLGPASKEVELFLSIEGIRQ